MAADLRPRSRPEQATVPRGDRPQNSRPRLTYFLQLHLVRREQCARAREREKIQGGESRGEDVKWYRKRLQRSDVPDNSQSLVRHLQKSLPVRDTPFPSPVCPESLSARPPCRPPSLSARPIPLSETQQFVEVFIISKTPPSTTEKGEPLQTRPRRRVG